MVIDFAQLSEYFNFISPILTLVVGWFGQLAFTRFRKRTEEVGVTGTEHDTVKRISQSSIETIERLNLFSEQLSEKMLEQRTAFNDAITKLELEVETMRKVNTELRIQNVTLMEINIKLQKVIDEYTNGRSDKG